MTIAELREAILTDPSLTIFEKQRVLSQLDALSLGRSPYTQLSALGAVGGALGVILARYQRLSMPGMALAGALGFGIGQIAHGAIQSTINQGNQNALLRARGAYYE